MKKTLLAFFGLAFIVYWFWTADLRFDRPAALDPVLPALVRMLPSPTRLYVTSTTDRDTAPSVGLRKWLNEEVIKVAHVDSNPSGTVIRLKKKALSLKPNELTSLKQIAMDPTASGDERFFAVYIIGLSESALAKDELKEIGESTIPATANDRAYSDEVVIRAQALEAVLQHLSPADSINYLRKVLATTTDPSVAKHARYWLTRLG